MDVRAVTGIYRFLKARRFDIVHTHSSKAGFVGRVAARRAGAPVIIHTPNGHVFYGYFGPIASRLCLALERWCARFTAIEPWGCGLLVARSFAMRCPQPPTVSRPALRCG